MACPRWKEPWADPIAARAVCGSGAVHPIRVSPRPAALSLVNSPAREAGAGHRHPRLLRRAIKFQEIGEMLEVPEHKGVVPRPTCSRSSSTPILLGGVSAEATDLVGANPLQLRSRKVYHHGPRVRQKAESIETAESSGVP